METEDAKFKLFLKKILEIREQVTTISELCNKVTDLYYEYFALNITKALLGFLVRPKLEGELSSGNCNKYARDHTEN